VRKIKMDDSEKALKHLRAINIRVDQLSGFTHGNTLAIGQSITRKEVPAANIKAITKMLEKAEEELTGAQTQMTLALGMAVRKY
jgi:hypothetical protein